MWAVVGVVGLVVLVATYLTGVATRVERLHTRMVAARQVVDAQSVRRAQAAVELGEREHLVDAVEAGEAVLAASAEARVEAENVLTRVLRLAATKFDAEVLTDVAETSRRLAIARQLHSDRVRDARVARERPLAQWLGFGRHQAEPEFFDIDDPALDTPLR